MTTPLLELEGTWEQIAAQIPDFAGQKLRVLVSPAEENRTAAPDTRPIAEVLAEIAATIPASELAKLPPDFTDQLDHYIYGTPKLCAGGGRVTGILTATVRTTEGKPLETGGTQCQRLLHADSAINHSIKRSAIVLFVGLNR